MTDEYDIVISGAGPVGLCMAIALSCERSSTLDPVPRILVLDVGAKPNAPKSESGKALGKESEQASVFDERRFALSRSSMRFLQRLGLWSAVAKKSLPIEEILVWQAQTVGRTLISANAEQLNELGVAVTFQALGQVLQSAVAALPNVTLCFGAIIQQSVRAAAGWHLSITDESRQASAVRAKWLVVAEGARSKTREQLGIVTEVLDYQQTACVMPCRMVGANVNPYAAYECFTADGSLAVLPGEQGVRWLIWALPRQQAQQYSDAPEQLLQLTQHTLGRRFRCTHVTESEVRVSQYALQQSIALEQVRPHLLLIGNAAHSLHPIAGQGLNLALRDISLLFELWMHTAWQSIVSPQGFGFLQQYAALRAQDQQRIQLFCDQLVKGFRRKGRYLQHLRSLGLLVFDVLPGAKQQLSQKWLAPVQRWQDIAV